MSDFGKLTPLGWVKLIAAIAAALAGVLTQMFPNDPEVEPSQKNAKK